MPSLGNGTYHPAKISWWDKSLEVGSLEVYGKPVTATYVDPDVVNFTAESNKWAALVTASNAMVLGLQKSANWVNEIIVHSSPSQGDVNQSASREQKLLIQYIDTTSEKRFTRTLPTLDLTKVTYLPQAGDFVAITAEQGAGAEVVAFVAAFEAYVVNPDASSNPIEIVGLKVVGRNN